jgi:hypothetical protein
LVKTAIVRVHLGVTVGHHDLGGMHLTVVDVLDGGVLELSEYAGNCVFLRASDVDVVSRPAGVA